MADIPDFEKQAKDAVAASIASGSGAAMTAPLICQQISHAAHVGPDPKLSVIAVCRGSMKAVLLGGQSVPDAAVALLTALPNTSLIMRAGPEELMSWVMEGVADVTPLAGPEVRDALRAKIEENFMGASTIFDGFCDTAARRG
jgi:hypothetical protein